MNLLPKPEPGALRGPLGIFLGVFAGVLLAELLSTRVSPTAAWLIGGAVIGSIPSTGAAPRSATRVLATVACTACVAAAAHWLASLVA